jgi:hypothetical protein
MSFWRTSRPQSWTWRRICPAIRISASRWTIGRAGRASASRPPAPTSTRSTFRACCRASCWWTSKPPKAATRTSPTASVHGYDATGLRPRDLTPEIYGKLIHAHYRAAVEARQPLAHVIVMITNKKQRSYARLILPLSDDGETINMLMTVDSGTQNLLQEFLETIQAIGQRE